MTNGRACTTVMQNLPTSGRLVPCEPTPRLHQSRTVQRGVRTNWQHSSAEVRLTTSRSSGIPVATATTSPPAVAADRFDNRFTRRSNIALDRSDIYDR